MISALSLCKICIHNICILQESSGLGNQLSLRCLVPWTEHIKIIHVCQPSFRKQKFVCTFDITEKVFSMFYGPHFRASKVFIFANGRESTWLLGKNEKLFQFKTFRRTAIMKYILTDPFGSVSIWLVHFMCGIYNSKLTRDQQLKSLVYFSITTLWVFLHLSNQTTGLASRTAMGTRLRPLECVKSS